MFLYVHAHVYLHVYVYMYVYMYMTMYVDMYIGAPGPLGTLEVQVGASTEGGLKEIITRLTKSTDNPNEAYFGWC